jgi:hypothetical protein
MAVITKRNLVLQGVCVLRDVLACVKTKSFSPARGQTEAMRQSPRLVHGVRETNPGKRPDIGSDGRAVFGTGRSQRYRTGIPSCPASSARQAILSGWHRSMPTWLGNHRTDTGRPALDLQPIAKFPKS